MSTATEESVQEKHYKVVAGLHYEDTGKGKQKVYKRGEIITSPLNLIEMFPNKFEEVHETRLPVRKAAPAPAREVSEREVSEPVRGKNKFGKDITANYESAEDAGFQVFIDKEGAVTVVDEDAPEVALNEVPLRKSKVDSFIAKHLKN